MTANSHGNKRTNLHQIELKLRDVSQLFNTMDPSPFHEKDLDHDAEEFIVSWAREFPLDEPVALVVHQDALPQERDAQSMIQRAIHHYFGYRLEINRLEFRHLMQDGRRSLTTGLLFLAACLAISKFLVGEGPGAFSAMEIYLYDWWPVRRRQKILRKLSRMPVEVRIRK
ncbi:MAG: hypothetical protein NT154_24470 [Verrucomicrobia bacterium]|nr:hypothetical protein [Verrucomicrobiota bacterium]